MMIRITINNTCRSVPNKTSVYRLLKKSHISPTGIAVAINAKVIEKASWDKTKLKEGDSILIIRATQGG